jgi:Poxvirus A32 protein
MILCGPSGCGKSRLLLSLLLDIWVSPAGKSCFERIILFSPSHGLDSTWDALEKFQKIHMKVPKDENLYFNTWDERRLLQIIEDHRQIVTRQKQLKMSRMYSLCLIIDDFADAPQIRTSPALQQLFIRGRHSFLTTVASVQALKVLNPVVRKNATDLAIFRLRSAAEAEGIFEEYGAVYGSGRKGRDTIRAIYDSATAQPYDFLWVNARAKNPENLFWRNFEERLVLDNDSGSTDSSPKKKARSRTTKIDRPP